MKKVLLSSLCSVSIGVLIMFLQVLLFIATNMLELMRPLIFLVAFFIIFLVGSLIKDKVTKAK